MPFLILFVMGDKDFTEALFGAFAIQLCILLYLLKNCSHIFEPVFEAPAPSKSQKISVLRIGLCTMLFCIIVQSLIFYYFNNYQTDLSEYFLITIKCVVLALGSISPGLSLMVAYHSAGFFHPFDILDSYFFVLWIIGFVIQVNVCSEVEILYLYVPFYFSTIKAILMVFLDPSGIMDVTVTEQKDFVVFRTWSGKIYRGKPYDVSGSFGVELRDVTERIAPNTWKKARNGFRFQLSIIWMKKVPRKIEEIEC
ncbi:unnamed protein product [Caenorhabditis nigoni]